MRKTRKTTADLTRLASDAKRQKSMLHHAQRKYASTFPPSPSQRESDKSINQGFPKTEDFVEFLCVRNYPILPQDLEVFTQPLMTTRTLDDDDLDVFDTDDSQVNCRLTEISGRNFNPIVTLSRIVLEERFLDNCSVDSDYTVYSETEVFTPDENSVVLSVMTPLVLQKYNATMKQMEDFQSLFSEMNGRTVLLIAPPDEWIVPQYIQDDLEFIVTTKHIHRLKHTVCENFLTLLCIKRQLELESDTKLTELPKIGLVELDLSVLMETVNIFGGLESVNSDQNWRVLADYLNIPKSASRRVTKLESSYLKYIFPYDLLSTNEKEKLRNDVKNDRNFQNSIPVSVTTNKSMSLETFHRIVCNSQCYWKRNEGAEDIEKDFWNIVNNGHRHIAVVSGGIDLVANPHSYQRVKNKPLWNLQNLNSVTSSALKYLSSKISEVNCPFLKFDGTYSTSEWCCEKNGFYYISYMHTGEDKIWYVVPRDMKSLFARIQEKLQTFVTIDDLAENNCQVHKVIQKEGEYVIIEPSSYYLTISTGYSCSETVSYCPMSWFLSTDALDLATELESFVHSKMFLLLAMEESKKSKETTIFKSAILSFLERVGSLVSENVEELQRNGIQQIFTKKQLKSTTEQRCCICRKNCFFITVITNSKSDTDVHCVGDAITLVRKKKVKSKDLRVEYISVETILKKFQ